MAGMINNFRDHSKFSALLETLTFFLIVDLDAGVARSNEHHNE